MKTIHRLEIVVAESDYDCATGLLALEVPFGWEEQSLPTGETRFRVHCEQKDFLERLQQLLKQTVPAAESALSELEETDWLAAWRQFFTPVCCGNHFVVLPPWLADTQDFPGRTPILIEPKSAFGTGHHATTALCLRVVSDLLEAGRLQQGQHFLDLGTGSGVLGIGCCKFGLTGEGLDIDPLAVDNAVENRALTDMAADIVRACRPGGCLVLSGLLEIQADGVTAAYKAQGLPEPRRIIDGEWAALVWDSVK